MWSFTIMLDKLISQLADLAEKENIDPNSCIGFVMRNCTYNPGDEFYICTLLQAELADRNARREGFKGQFDRAAKRAFSRNQH